MRGLRFMVIERYSSIAVVNTTENMDIDSSRAKRNIAAPSAFAGRVHVTTKEETTVPSVPDSTTTVQPQKGRPHVGSRRVAAGFPAGNFRRLLRGRYLFGTYHEDFHGWGSSHGLFHFAGKRTGIRAHGTEFADHHRQQARQVGTTASGESRDHHHECGGQAERVIARSASAAVTENFPAKTSASTQPTPSKPAPGASDNQTASRPANNTPSEPWPGFLGPDLQNRSTDKNLLATWPVDGPGLLWTARNLGEGYSSVSIAEGKLFSMGTRQGREVVLAFDLQTGRELWAVNSGAVFNDNMGNGPRSTPTYENGRLYTLGASGDLTAINAANGTILWQQNILSQHAARNIVWGISESPLIDGDKLICTPGGNGATMVALNKNNGQTIWQAAIPGNPQAGYSTAIVTDLNGVRQYVNFCHNGLFSVDARTGQPLWGDNNAANSTANCSSPIAIGNNSIFYASGYGTGGRLVAFCRPGSETVPGLQDRKNEESSWRHG